MKLQFIKLHDEVELPVYSHTNDAGADIKMYKDIVIKHGENKIPLGFSCIIPPGCAAFLTMRSSWMSKGIIANFVPIDPDYKGEWHLLIYNIGDEFIIKKGERISQVVILSGVQQCEFVETIDYVNNQRHSNGLGSTGN